MGRQRIGGVGFAKSRSRSGSGSGLGLSGWCFPRQFVGDGQGVVGAVGLGGLLAAAACLHGICSTLCAGWRGEGRSA